MRIILASSSPRRSELLASLGLDFEVLPSRVEESSHGGEPLADYIMWLARAKVSDVASVASRCQSGLIIGADTIVVVDQQVLGKPADEAAARRMLRLLSGRWHSVMTAVVLCDVSSGREAADFEETRVRFSALSEQEIDWYVKTGEPLDKAGAYAIQGRAAVFVEEITGNYHNVVGLPLSLVYRLAKELGYSLLA